MTRGSSTFWQEFLLVGKADNFNSESFSATVGEKKNEIYYKTNIAGSHYFFMVPLILDQGCPMYSPQAAYGLPRHVVCPMEKHYTIKELSFS